MSGEEQELAASAPRQKRWLWITSRVVNLVSALLTKTGSSLCSADEYVGVENTTA